jgi:hypothetical protein
MVLVVPGGIELALSWARRKLSRSDTSVRSCVELEAK